MSKSESSLISHLTAVAVRYLSFKPRFSGEVRIRLQQETDNPKSPEINSLIDSILGKLERNKFLDDEGLAIGVSLYLLKTKHKGPKYIKLKLLSRGLKAGFVDKIIKDNLTREAQLEVLRQIITQKTKSNLPLDVKAKSRLIRFLISRGFTYETIRYSLDGTGQIA